MKTIRPYQVFQLFDAPPNDRTAHIQIPPRRGFGNLTLLETFVVIAAIRAVNATRVFEFGTFLGSTALNLAMNLPAGGELFTLDLEAPEEKPDNEDAAIMQAHFAAPSMDFAGSPAANRVRQLYGDSRRFDFSNLRGTMDFVFIDGGHDFETVATDTENAFKLVRPRAAILWHDYQNSQCPDVTMVLDQRTEPIFHIGDTMLCAWFSDIDIVNRLHSDPDHRL
jgi:hypothetical protein